MVSVACRLAVRATLPETQVSVMFCAVTTPAVKVSVAGALVRVKLAASAPLSVKLVKVVVPASVPPEGVPPQSGRCRWFRRWSRR